MDIREYLKDNLLLFDGAMGTYYSLRNPDTENSCELGNLTNPGEIEAIHHTYIEAGAAAIKTNTFGANRPNLGSSCAAVIRAGYELACRAAGEAYVFADIGPIDGHDCNIFEEYRFVADEFLALGADKFLFETNSVDIALSGIAAYIKERRPDAFIIVSYASQPDGFTRAGHLLSDLYESTSLDPNIDSVGMNCVSGARHMNELTARLDRSEKILSVMPNAGYPVVRNNRTYYDSNPEYFAMQLAALRDQGARILGGCCGTTPDYIAAAAKALKEPAILKPVPVIKVKIGTAPGFTSRDLFWKDLCAPDKKPFAVELDSPENADITKFMDGARRLRENGAALITIADCPIARARMDSSLMACKIRRELDMEAMPHMTCRDRNLNATQALLLGLCAEDIRNVLLVTGDPIPSANRDEVKSVYNFNSRKLIKYADGLNRSMLPVPFHIFGALNLNVRNFHMQLQLAQEKEENGAVGFFTQPVLTAQALENLKLARGTLKGRILGGIIPVISQRNALFMNSEISGITVDEKIIKLYEGADREKGEELAVTVSAAIAREIAPYVDGFYLMTPFGRTALIARIMDRIREDGLA